MSTLNIKPLADRVVVEPIAAETTTASGLIIPDSAKEKPSEGTVVAKFACFEKQHQHKDYSPGVENCFVSVPPLT